jgi:hypothetical protein
MIILNASDPNNAKKINDIIKKIKHVFILVYMVGCGPCNATRPEWKKMCQAIENKYSSNGDVAILDLDSKFMNEVKGIGDVSGFPTMKYISNNGNKIESYEDSNIPNKKRSSDSFINWIDSKVLEPISITSSIFNKNDHKLSAIDLSKKISSKQRNSAKSMGIENEVKKRKNRKNKKTKKVKSRNNKKSRKTKIKNKKYN